MERKIAIIFLKGHKVSALFIFIGIILSLAQVKINGEVFLLRREPNNLKSQHLKGSEIETLPCKEC